MTKSDSRNLDGVKRKPESRISWRFDGSWAQNAPATSDLIFADYYNTVENVVFSSEETAVDLQRRSFATAVMEIDYRVCRWQPFETRFVWVPSPTSGGRAVAPGPETFAVRSERTSVIPRRLPPGPSYFGVQRPVRLRPPAASSERVRRPRRLFAHRFRRITVVNILRFCGFQYGRFSFFFFLY